VHLPVLKLVIGNKNYSTWSLRPWLLLRHHDIPFEEVRIALNLQETPAQLQAMSPTSKVPVLYDDDLVIWDSLAICEYVSERLLDGKGWPAAAASRGRARSVAAEMHSGFNALRNQWPMNIRLQRPMPVEGDLKKDIRRIEQLWQECLDASGGPWLFGEFSIADAMFAPVVMRFYSYHPVLGDTAAGYCRKMLSNSALQQWMAAGVQEKEVIREDEIGYLLGEPGW
jgi:glutathione S-transferase